MKNADCLDGWWHGLIPSKKFNIPLAALSVVLSTIGGQVLVFGQSPELSFTEKQLQDAVRQLESNSAEDLDKSAAVLKRAIKEPAFRELATCSLALVYLKQGNLESIGNFLRKINTVFPSPTPAQKNLLIRVQLNYDFAKGSENASAGFSNLVLSTLDDKLEKSSRLANAAMLGSFVGMLELDAALSPIDREVLASAKDSMLKSANTELINTFDSNYRKAKTHAAELAEWISNHQKLSLDEAIELAAASQEELRTTTQDRDQSVDKIRQEIKEHRKTAFQMTRKKEAIQQEIRTVLYQWKSHPEIHNPIKPDRSRIQVKTTHKVKVGSHKEKTRKTRRNSKGETEEYYEDEVVSDYEERRRPQADIDRDIDVIFTPLLNQYLALKAAGKALMDQNAALEFQFQNAQNEVDTANRAVDELELKGKDEQAFVKRLRSESKITREAVDAIKSGRIETAFRPPNFELFDYALEAKALKNQQMAAANGATENR